MVHTTRSHSPPWREGSGGGSLTIMSTSKNLKRLRVYRVLAGINNSEHFLFCEKADENAIQFLREQMATHIIKIVFRKEDGTRCERRGTLHPKYTANYYAEHPGEREQRYVKPDTLRYWDLNRNYWRSCVAERIIGYYAEFEVVEED